MNIVQHKNTIVFLLSLVSISYLAGTDTESNTNVDEMREILVMNSSDDESDSSFEGIRDTCNYFMNILDDIADEEEEKEEPEQKVFKAIKFKESDAPLLQNAFAVLKSSKRNAINTKIHCFTHRKYLEKISPLMLIFGPTGCGKSLLARAIEKKLSENKWNTYRSYSSDFATEFQNSGTENIFKIYKKLKKEDNPSVIIIEDVNGLYPNFENNGDLKQIAIGLWQFADLVKNDKERKIVLIATESDTKMPPQTKERFLGGIIKLKNNLSRESIEKYFDFRLKNMPHYFQCVHAPINQSKPSSEAIKGTSRLPSEYWFVTACTKGCRKKVKEIVMRRLQQYVEYHKSSYKELEDIFDNALRKSTSHLWRFDLPDGFILEYFLDITRDKRRAIKYLKLNKKYKSKEEERQEKNIAAERKRFEESFGMQIKHMKQSYKQSIQQLLHQSQRHLLTPRQNLIAQRRNASPEMSGPEFFEQFDKETKQLNKKLKQLREEKKND